MLRIRPIEKEDLESLVALAEEAEPGMTNLPKSKKLLSEMVNKSIIAFKNKDKAKKPHLYLFVAEDLETKNICGVSGIYSLTGYEKPLEYYSVIQVPIPSPFEGRVRTTPALKKIIYKRGPSEVCSLFVTKAARKMGAGKLLSFSRFFYIAAFRQRFTETIFAELRGLSDHLGNCPFWDNLGRYFLPLSFKELMDNHEIDKSSFLPDEPIFLNPLSFGVKNTLGKTHPNTLGALQLLESQGFIKTGEVDLYDAGPRLIARIDDITILKNSKVIKIDQIKNSKIYEEALISNEKNEFLACIGKIHLSKDLKFGIDEETASALNVKEGDKVRYAIL